jgi:hypothetical protein
MVVGARHCSLMGAGPSLEVVVVAGAFREWQWALVERSLMVVVVVVSCIVRAKKVELMLTSICTCGVCLSLK